jgi:hypothetical protein
LTDEGMKEWTWLRLIEIDKESSKRDIENFMIILKQFDLRKKVSQKTKEKNSYLIPWLIYHYTDRAIWPGLSILIDIAGG